MRAVEILDQIVCGGLIIESCTIWCGSGGHITPILAVADELKNIDSTTEVIYIGQTGDKLGDIPKAHKSIDKVYSVRAGKFRRFYNEGIKADFRFAGAI